MILPFGKTVKRALRQTIVLAGVLHTMPTGIADWQDFQLTGHWKSARVPASGGASPPATNELPRSDAPPDIIDGGSDA